MKTKFQIFETQDSSVPARLVWDVNVPRTSVDSGTLKGLDTDTYLHLQSQARDVLGVPLDYDALSNDADALGDTVRQLAEKCDLVSGEVERWERLCAMMAPAGLKPSEIAGYLHEPAHVDSNTPTPDGFEQEENIPPEDHKSALHAAKVMRENPTWKQLVHEASERHVIPESTIIAIIEMESSWRPNATNGTAIGLAQGEPKARSEYANEIKRTPDLRDPATAIDFVAWYSALNISRVNWTITNEGAAKGYKGEYALDQGNADDVKNLYLAYTCGAEGYLQYRRWIDPDNVQSAEQNYNALPPFFRGHNTWKGEQVPGWQFKQNIATRVSNFASVLEGMDTHEVVAFDSPPLRLDTYRISSGFGHRLHPKTGEHDDHNGVDIPAPTGTPVLAIKPGVVTLAENNRSGKFVRIQHPDGTSSSYAHLSAYSVSNGDSVPAGQEIGKVGETGSATGPHLHFRLNNTKGQAIDPQASVEASFGAASHQ